MSLIIIDYEDVASSKVDLSVQLERAFGSSGLGIVAIRGVPGFLNAKQKFLPKAHTLAHLDKDYLEKELSDAKSFYNAGWSHGVKKSWEMNQTLQRHHTTSIHFQINPVLMKRESSIQHPTLATSGQMKLKCHN